MKSDIVLRIEKALKEYTPSKIDGVRIATARGILTAYEIAVKNGLSEAGKVDCIKVCESFMLPPITYGVTNPEEHYITAGATRRSAATYRLYHCTRRTLQ